MIASIDTNHGLKFFVGKLPCFLKSLSVLTNLTTIARGRAANHSSFVDYGGIAFITLFSKCSFEYMAALDPLCPTKNFGYRRQLHQSANRQKQTWKT
jgi:hypothetical protein